MSVGCLSSLCGASGSKQLILCARTGDAQLAAEIIRKTPILAQRAQQWGGQTAWHLAAKEGHSNVLQAMADTIRALTPEQLQPLQRYGATAEEIITYLAQEEDSKCLTPLHLACIKGHAHAAALIMNFGVNPFTMDSVGRTALHYAASWGHADCISAVLSMHSGPPKPQWHVAAPNDEDTALVDVQNMSGYTPLHYAVWVGRKTAIQALASYDASLKVVNIANDYDWIKVGAGNTPLHLAAFSGDFEVVKLLLAAHVQTLSAGAEVMAAAQGQWGERHADDVRHMRNRRGLMAYHIAIERRFAHLAELLHPDIPYTFIFSNDDMQVGSVRMYGPARLMVIAARALQQKLVDELAAVEQAAVAAGPAAAAAAAAVTKGDAAPAGAAVLVLAAGGGSSGEQQHEQPQQQEEGSLLLEAAAAAEGEGEAPELLSPFAAKSHKRWSASVSEASACDTAAAAAATAAAAGSAASAAFSGVSSSMRTSFTAAHPTPAGLTTSLVSDADSASTLAAADAAADADAAAAGSALAAPGAAAPVEAEYSFAPTGSKGVLSPTATAPPALLAGGQFDAVEQDSSFTGFALAQQQQQQGLSAVDSGSSASRAAGLSQSGAAAAGQQLFSSAASDLSASMSSSTIPGSTSAVAGTPAGSVIMPESAASSRGGPGSSRHAAAASPAALNSSSNSLTSRYPPQVPDHIGRGTAGTSGARQGDETVLQWLPGSSSVPVPASSAAVANDSGRSTVGAAGAAASAAAGGWTGSGVGSSSFRHRRVQSTTGVLEGNAKVLTRQGSRSNADGRRATAESWLRPMGSFRMGSSRRALLDDDVLPPSVIITTAADDDKRCEGSSRSTNPSSAHPTRRTTSARGLTSRLGPSGPGRAAQAAQPASQDPAQQQWQAAAQGAAATNSSSNAALDDNPLDVMLAHRASMVGEDPEAIRQQIVMMKLASGCLNFNTAVTAFSASLQLPDALGSSRRASVAAASGRKSSITGSRPSSLSAQSAASAPLTADQLPGTGEAAAGAAGAAVAAPPGGLASPFSAAAVPAGTDASPRASLDMAAGAAAGQSAAGAGAGAPSLASMRNSSMCRSVIASQPSLQRLLSGNSRSQLSLRPSEDTSIAAAVAAAAAAVAAPANEGGGMQQSSTWATANGDLPIIQQQLGGSSGMIEEEGESGDGDEFVCEICFDAQALVALQACGHMLCVTCCKEMCKLHHFKPALCPYCRQIICGFGLRA